MKKWVLAFLMCVSVSPAYAFFYEHGDQFVKVADLPDIKLLEVKNKPGKYVDVGYCYKQLKILFIPVWNWEERYCGYIDETIYSKVDKERLLKISQLLNVDTSWDDGKSKIPMWERVWGKVAFGFVLLLFIAYQASRKRD